MPTIPNKPNSRLIDTQRRKRSAFYGLRVQTGAITAVAAATASAGHVIAVSYKAPDPYPTCGSGTAYVYVFDIDSGLGALDLNATPEAADRRLAIGTGIPSSPRVTVASDPADDIGFVTTSDGQVLSIEPPLRDGPESETVYWRQRF